MEEEEATWKVVDGAAVGRGTKGFGGVNCKGRLSWIGSAVIVVGGKWLWRLRHLQLKCLSSMLVVTVSN